MGNFVGWFERSYKGIIVALVAIMAIMLVVLAMQQVSASRPAERAEAAPIPTFSSEPVEVRRLAVIGDSYTAGTDNPTIWPSIVARTEHYNLFDAGVPGAAYTGDGPTFQQQVQGVVDFKPTVLLMMGGRNDSLRAGQVPDAAVRLYTTLKQQLPSTKIVIIGPVWDSTTPTSGVEAVNAATRAAAASAGLDYRDVLDERWLSDSALIGPDGIHPNDAGHKKLAQEILPILQSAENS